MKNLVHLFFERGRPLWPAQLHSCTGTGVRSVRIEDDPSHPIHDLPISVFICKLTTSFSQQHQHHSCLSSCPRALLHQPTAQPIVRPQLYRNRQEEGVKSSFLWVLAKLCSHIVDGAAIWPPTGSNWLHWRRNQIRQFCDLCHLSFPVNSPQKVAILAEPAIFQGHEDFQSTSYPQEKSRWCACSSASMQCGE